MAVTALSSLMQEPDQRRADQQVIGADCGAERYDYDLNTAAGGQGGYKLLCSSLAPVVWKSTSCGIMGHRWVNSLC